MAKRLQDDPLLGLAYLITTLLTIAGIGQAVDWILESGQSKALLIGLSACVGVMLIAYLRRPPAMRLFNISRIGKVVSLSQHQEIVIDKEGWARLSFSSTILFLESPEPNDYRHKLHCDERMEFERLNYASSVSTPVRTVRENESLVAVYHKPNVEAEPLKPWTDEFSFDIPENVLPDYYCVRVAIPTPTGRSSVRVSSAVPLERVVCFKESRTVSGDDYDRLARYALRHIDSGAPPAQNQSSTGFNWEIIRPDVGEIYNLMFFFEGGVERFLASQKWRARLARWWTKLRRTELPPKRTRSAPLIPVSPPTNLSSLSTKDPVPRY